MPEFNFIKNFQLTLIKFGGDKKIEVASGKQSEGVIVLASPLGPKAVDLSRNSTYKRAKRLKSPKVI